jgi:hypothetical protein
MSRVSLETIALRRTFAAVSLAFLAAFAATTKVVFHHCIGQHWAAERWSALIPGIFEALFYSFCGGGMVAIAAGWLVNHWYHLRGAYPCLECGRPIRRPASICPCRHREPAVQRIMAADALRRRQRFRHLRPRRLLAVLNGYAAVAVLVACIRPFAPGLRHAPVYPDLVLTHMMLCFLAVVIGHPAVEALKSFRKTRFRYRPRAQIYLLLFCLAPLAALLAWTCGVVFVR